MGPPCTLFGPWAHLNRVMNPVAWYESYRQCKPIGVLCGQFALHQLQNRGLYLVEQPDPSGLFTEHLWPRVQARPHNLVQLVRQ
eukprot:776153-Lingulodinium_polyedra.AAC.1